MTETQLQAPQRPPQTTLERSSTSDYVTVIQPPSKWPRPDLPELWRFRELMGVFVWRDLKVRYKQTVIGVGWALIQPILPTVVFTLVLGKFANAPSDRLPYPIFAFAGLLLLQYFSSALNVSSGSLVANVGLVTKVYFPRLLLPLAAVATPLVDLLLGVGLLVVAMAIFNTWPAVAVLTAPLFVVIAFVTALGVGLVFAALNVRYRDIPYVLPIFIQLLPYASGVVFAVSALAPTYQWLLALNPMTSAVWGWRWAMLDGPPPNWGPVALSAGVAALLLVGGFAFFKRAEPKFADRI